LKFFCSYLHSVPCTNPFSVTFENWMLTFECLPRDKQISP